MEKHIYSIGPIRTNDISHCYDVKYGVLEQYMGKKFSREEIDEIICEMIKNHPYIPGAWKLEIIIMRFKSIHQILNFRNYDYHNQKAGDRTIRYEKSEKQLKDRCK